MQELKRSKWLWCCSLLLSCFFVSYAAASEQAELQLDALNGKPLTSGLLLDTQVDMQVQGLLNQVKITQVFKNTHKQVVNAKYVFPLPDESAVYQMRMQIGERIINGQIKEKQQAQQLYQQAQQQGKKAALMTQKRANVFISQVANIEPGQSISVELVYIDKVKFEHDQFTIVLPTVVAPRYQPEIQLFDVDLTSGWAMSSDVIAATQSSHIASKAPMHRFSLNIELNSGFELANIYAINHQIDVTQQEQGHYHIKLAQEDTGLANQDFELRYQAKVNNEVKAALFSERFDGEEYGLLMLVPPARSFVRQQRLARELVFVIDTSGSMEGRSLSQAKQALLYALDNLDSQDNFNIIEFNSKVKGFSTQALAATEANLQLAKQFVNNLRANGGTEIFDAFAHVLAAQGDNNYLRQIVFLTDGSVSNEQQVVEFIKHNIADNRLFTIGIGSAPNHYFMNRSAEVGRGNTRYISHASQVQQQMTSLFKQLAHPVIKQLSLTSDGQQPLSYWPKQIPDLYFGEPLLLAFKFTQDAQQYTVSGESAGHKFNASFKRPQTEEGDAIARLWARQKIKSLLLNKYGDQTNIKVEVLSTALKYQLMSPYTAFVALEQKRDIKESKPNEAQIAVKTVRINGMRPAGWTMGLPQTDGQSQLHILLGLLLLSLAMGCGVLLKRYQYV